VGVDVTVDMDIHVPHSRGRGKCSEPPTGPNYPADDRNGGTVHIRPSGIGRII